MAFFRHKRKKYLCVNVQKTFVNIPSMENFCKVNVKYRNRRNLYTERKHRADEMRRNKVCLLEFRTCELKGPSVKKRSNIFSSTVR